MCLIGKSKKKVYCYCTGNYVNIESINIYNFIVILQKYPPEVSGFKNSHFINLNNGTLCWISIQEILPIKDVNVLWFQQINN